MGTSSGRTSAFLLSLLAACTASPSVRPDSPVRIETSVGSSQLDGGLGFQLRSSQGLDQVLESTSIGSLGLADSGSAPGLHIEVDLAGPRLVVSSVRAESAGSGVLAGEFELVPDGSVFESTFVRYPAATTLESSLGVSVHQATLLFPAPILEENVEFGLGLEAIDVDGTFRGDGLLLNSLGAVIGGLEERETRINSLLPLPVISSALRGEVAGLPVRADVSWIRGSSGSKRASVLSYDLAILLGSTEDLSAVLGYRSNHMEIRYENLGQSALVDLELSGLYAGLRVQF